MAVGKAGFGVLEPAIAELLAIGVGALAGIERDGLAGRDVDIDWRCSAVAVHDCDGIVIGVRKVGAGPRYARGKIILEGLAPAPDGRLIGYMLIAINADHCIR